MAAAERRAPRAECLAGARLCSMVSAFPIGAGWATCRRGAPHPHHREGVRRGALRRPPPPPASPAAGPLWQRPPRAASATGNAPVPAEERAKNHESCPASPPPRGSTGGVPGPALRGRGRLQPWRRGCGRHAFPRPPPWHGGGPRPVSPGSVCSGELGEVRQSPLAAPEGPKAEAPVTVCSGEGLLPHLRLFR